MHIIFLTGTSKLWILEKKIIITSFILHYLVLKYRKYLFKSSKSTCSTQNHAYTQCKKLKTFYKNRIQENLAT